MRTTRKELATASYDRPTKATLHVQLENGETWAATAEDLEQFGLVRKLDAYMRFNDALEGALRTAGLLGSGQDITDAELNSVRYLAETAIVIPELLDHEDHEGWDSVAALERRLRETREDA